MHNKKPNFECSIMLISLFLLSIVCEGENSRISRFISSPKERIVYLQFEDIPSNKVPLDGLGYSVELNGKPVTFPQGWDRGYIPHFIPIGSSGKFTRFLFTVPLKLKSGENEVVLQASKANSIRNIKFVEGIADKIVEKVEITGVCCIITFSSVPER